MSDILKKDNKKLIYSIPAIIVIIIIVLVAIILATKSGNQNLSDGFFVSDDTKYVATLGPDNVSSIIDESYMPNKIHLVYFYSDNKITGLKSYYEYDNEASAKTAYDFLKSDENDYKNYKSLSQSGKYVIIDAYEEDWNNITLEEAKQRTEVFNSFNAEVNNNDSIMIEEEKEEDGKDEEENNNDTEEEVIEAE